MVIFIGGSEQPGHKQKSVKYKPMPTGQRGWHATCSKGLGVGETPAFHVGTPRREQGWARSEVRASSNTGSCAVLGKAGGRVFPACTLVYVLPGLLIGRCHRKDCAEGQIFPEVRVRPRRKVNDHFTYYSCVTSHPKAQWLSTMAALFSHDSVYWLSLCWSWTRSLRRLHQLVVGQGVLCVVWGHLHVACGVVGRVWEGSCKS